MASHNNGTKKVASSPSKSSAAQYSKRKKDLENSKEGTVMVLGRVKHEWNQTDETLQISLFADKLSPDQLKAADVEVSDVGVHATFADGREWACKFVEAQEVEGKQSRVVVQGNKLCVWLIKKKAKKWAKLHVTDPLPRGKKKGSGDVKVLSKTQEKVEVLGDPGKLDRHVTSSAGDDQETGCENKVKDEEPVYYLQHTKNDWIESSKNDIFTVHVYVRQAPKDTVKVFYEKTTVTVKFQTKDSSFLALHANTTEETVFCWKINLKHEILPEQCRHKVTSSLIDITLQKKEPFRWRALEAPLNKAAGVSKSDTWIPAGKSTNQTKTFSTSSQSNVAFDELANVKMLDEDDLELTEDNTSKLTTSTSMFPEKDNKENVMQKPMCKVSPLNKPSPPEESLVSPGMTGLENLGNTCFMNSVLQALANTREFRDYFLDARFQKEINTDNVLGSGGKLAVGFAVLMKVLWAGTHYSYAPSKLKNLIALKASQFTGYAQHDAQEFMAFLLDGLHEDLNRIKKKPYIETKDSGDRPDEVVADEAWTAYKKRNDSFVVDLFQGQYKSKLVCPECGKVSITFDPFLYLSVPLTKKKRMLQVIFMSKEPYNKPLRMLVTLAKDARGDQLKEQVSRETGIKTCDMRIFEAYKGRIHKFFRRSCDLSNIQPTDTIIVCEVLSEEVAGEAVYEIPVIQRTVMPNQIPTKCAECKKPCPENGKLKRCTKCYKVGYCDQACQKQHWQYHKPHCKNTLEPVGCPFILSIPQSRATFSRLCKLMEAHARFSVDVFQPPVKAESPSKLTSQLSNSDLSSSSQSGGSLSSLDSQSSLSSTCTLTADGETQVISDTEDGSSEAAPSNGGDSFPTKGDNWANLPTKGNNSVSPTSQGLDSTSSSGYASAASACGDSLSDGQLQNPQQTAATFSFTADEPTVDTSAVDMPPPASTVTPRLAVPSTSQGPDVFSGRSLPTHAVLGLQADDGERVTPQFYVKPVNQYGEGLTGPDGERLEDKGDVPLDLSEKHYLSMDWKNNDRLTPYVLVQTKKLETEDDASVHSAGLKESNITLDQCLRLFTEPEVLAPDEAWYCPQCKAHREATKQMSIWRLPHTLIIQLKRFSFRNFIWRDKIDEMVTFPTRGLDLSPYYIGTRPASEPRALYDLYAVVNHLGGILGGHYTSYVRCADLIDPCKSEVDWRLCDDSRVLTCRESNVVTRAAYVLFYRRRNMFVPLPPAIEDSDVTYDLEEESDEKGTNSVHGTSQSKDDELPDLIPEGDVFIKNQSKMSQPDNRLSEALDFTDMDSVD